MKKIKIAVFISLMLFTVVASIVTAQTGGGRGLLPRILPNCDPTLPPSDPLGCGLTAFVLLIRNIIKYLTYIVIPIAVIMFIWAAYVIITAGGSPAKFDKGKAIMTTAVIGVVIALGAGIIVGLIYQLFTGQRPPNLP